uniref:OB-fold nucleic acid binding domain protein n=1 Tax=uncultured marine crenarchaeote E48-1C TaxID=907718 RepID=G9BAS7_9ARCH|nr:OB-fold nucleic acid binding domain protein [uncultured marine crenarchaeote E48-1C]
MLRQVWRGRPPKSTHSYKDRRILEYLARIAMMYKVDTSAFFNCIVEAWNHKESTCKHLVIRCRRKTNDSAIFLFTNVQKVVAQFTIPTSILQGKNQLEDYTRTMQSRRASSVESHKTGNHKINDLKAGMKQIDLKAKVLEVPESKRVYTRHGNIAYVSNALIADETGSIRISLWNRQISTVSEGDMINIKSGKVFRFRGERQLRIGRHGSLSVIT